MRVLSLDANISDSRVTNASFASTISMFEYDVVIWDPVNTFDGYVSVDGPWESSKYENLVCLDLNKSTRFLSDVQRRGAEFEEFIALGRTLVVFASAPQELMIDSGKRETSGTGRNRVVTNLVDRRDLLAALPYSSGARQAEGEAITSSDVGLSRILRNHRKWWFYRAILTEYPGEPLATVTGTDKVVASLQRFDSGAVIAQIPDIYSCLPLGDEDDDSSEEEQVEHPDGLYTDLLEWVQELRSADDDVPQWASALHFVDAGPQLDEISRREEELARLNEELAGIKIAQAADRRWLTLVTGTGDALERRASEAFELLGYEISPDRPRRRDIRMTADGSGLVVEVKGVSKSAAESHVMQLEKWVAEAFLEHEEHHKGILLVNSWRELPPVQRVDPTFPAQLLGTATAREHCLLSGIQMLSIVRAVLAGRIGKAEVRAQLASTVGALTGWDDVGVLFASPPAFSDKPVEDSRPGPPVVER